MEACVVSGFSRTGVQMRFTPLRAFVVAVTAAAAIGVHSAGAQTAPDRAKLLRAAADALGMVRWSDIGAGTARLPSTSSIRWSFRAAGRSKVLAGRQSPVHADVGYNPPAMRVRSRAGPAVLPQRIIQTVREGYAWDESRVGAGLVPGKGVATPAMPALRERLLQLWTLPYGIVKAALSAGEKTIVSTEGGQRSSHVPYRRTTRRNHCEGHPGLQQPGDQSGNEV